MINGNDGGANVSFDGGRSWSRQDNQPTAQMYHVITDNRFPYFVYGAQQDNTTVALASASNEGGLDATQWYPVGGCESGYIAPSPADPQVVYAGCYGGQITRYDHRTGQERDITVWPENPMGWGAEGMKYRFQWTFPIVFSPHDPKVLYAGGDRVFRTTDEGQTWEAISGDLTRHDAAKLGSSGGPITKDNTSVEYYGTVFALAESPREKGVLWAGSDDGLVHVSRDNGKTWTNVTPREMPEWSLVSQIDVSTHQDGTAYLATTRYKLDDFTALRLGDHGLRQDLAPHHRRPARRRPSSARCARIPARRGLLYAGTETGVFVSFDDGGRWQPLRMALPGSASGGRALTRAVRASARPHVGHARPEGSRPAPAGTAPETAAGAPIEMLTAASTHEGELPVVPITDLVVQGDDLVVATQGRQLLDPRRPLTPAADGGRASRAKTRICSGRVPPRAISRRRRRPARERTRPRARSSITGCGRRRRTRRRSRSRSLDSAGPGRAAASATPSDKKDDDGGPLPEGDDDDGPGGGGAEEAAGQGRA